MREFSLNLVPDSKQQPLFVQIYGYFKDEIMQGKLSGGDFLPSIRSCAASLHVSKNTVELAYQLLVSEGYAISLPKKGYEIIGRTSSSPSCKVLSDAKNANGGSAGIDFRYGNIELAAFPFARWNKVRNAIIADHQSNYPVDGDSQGEYVLRRELSRLLFESRGVISTPEQIMIGATPQQLVSMLCQLLDAASYRVGVENPGYDGARNTFLNLGFQVHPIPLTPDGVSMNILEASGANVMYVSPSQQFMNKMSMSPEKRKQLVSWVDSNRYIIEDDYEWEYRYDEGYLPSIQSMRPEKVIYLGRISRTLLPVTNISYMVLPNELLSRFYRNIPEYDQPVPRIDQLTFSRYLSDGYWYKHLKKQRNQYEMKRSFFNEAVARYMGEVADIQSKDSGLHAFLTLRTEKTESELIELGLQRGVKVYGTDRYWVNRNGKHPTVLLGYGALTIDQIRQGIIMLAEAWA
ncbi:MocR-like pyridoxine biosynthesis transcription factor PdxR [Paenibacillus sp. DMB20]|uniref:MocR-like pyridoxine biosynthesis transcription factor PdxR n=1 Tax=Paenibacillus sp. DMB20 TaxID=1642570 RepID=UPI0006277EAA|nr:PLP-dependent aminotransferase family protein [Paenibacillus sp. DMB20]KKO52406.1 transcriptional regulator [Paenibacillus sp. DMB20]